MKKGKEEYGEEHLAKHEEKRVAKMVTGKACLVDEDGTERGAHEKEDDKDDVDLMAEMATASRGVERKWKGCCAHGGRWWEECGT